MFQQMSKPLRYWWYLIFALTALAVLAVTLSSEGGPSLVVFDVVSTVMGWGIIGLVGSLIIYIVLRVAANGKDPGRGAN